MCNVLIISAIGHMHNLRGAISLVVLLSLLLLLRVERIVFFVIDTCFIIISCIPIIQNGRFWVQSRGIRTICCTTLQFHQLQGICKH